MTTPTSKGGEKAATRKRRKRDSHAKTKPARKAADDFIETFTTHPGRGAVTRAAKHAYPNQSTTSAANTGSKLLKDPYVQEQIKIRQQACRLLAGVTREDIIGNLMSIIYGSIDDVTGKNGKIDWQKARERGIAHLVQEEEITERHGTDPKGRRTGRVTTRYKLPNKIQAMDLLTEMTGWKKQPAKNPIDAARETFLIMRQDERYKDIPNEELAKFPAQRFSVSVAEILEGQP